jgi:hypothetical protein
MFMEKLYERICEKIETCKHIDVYGETQLLQKFDSFFGKCLFLNFIEVGLGSYFCIY